MFKEIASKFATIGWLLTVPFVLSTVFLPAIDVARFAGLWEIGLVLGLSMRLATASAKIHALSQELAEDRYRSIFEHTGTAVVTIEADFTISAVNAEFSRLFGYQVEEVIGRPVEQFTQGQDLEMMRRYHVARRASPDGVPTAYECRLLDNHGRTKAIAITVSMIPGTDKSIASLIDITQRRRIEALVAEQRRQLYAIVQNLPCGLVMANEDGTVLYYNPVAEEILGYVMEDVPSVQALFALLYPDLEYRQSVLVEWEQDESEGQLLTDQVHEVVCRGGKMKHLSFGRASLDDGSSIITFVDATERVKNQQVIRQLAEHDFLTGLLNGRLLQERLAQDLARTKRSGGTLAVLFLDLDRFKEVNDSYGHQVGDELLCEVARRLQSAVRVSDTLGRIGGDEFCILLPDVTAEGDILLIADRVFGAFDVPCMISEHEISIYPSIGISVYPFDGDTPAELMRQADIAMYSVKKEGTSGYRFASREKIG